MADITIAVLLAPTHPSSPVSFPPVRPATSPAPPEQPRRAFSGGWLTPARRAMLTELWPTPMPVSEISAALAKLDAPRPVGTNQQIRSRAHQMGLHRHPSLLTPNLHAAHAANRKTPPPAPPSATSPASAQLPRIAAGPAVNDVAVTQAAAATTPPPGRIDTIRQVAVAEPFHTDQETIRSWAASRGIQMDKFDLKAVNAKAAAIGHPGFTLKQRIPHHA